MNENEMTAKLAEKMNVTENEAREALQACDWDMLDAALRLERAHGEAREAYSTRQAPGEGQGEAEAKPRRTVVQNLGAVLRKLINCGNRNHFEVFRKEALVLELPVTALALLLIFAFWVCVPLLVIGLFFGCRYRFSGEDLGRESINKAMDKAAEAADRVKEELRERD